jgi:hypothetical protein
VTKITKEDDMERDFCARCAIKHLGQAAILIKESCMGYPVHVYYAMAHMAEASDELVSMMPVEANRIRDERLKVEDSLRTGVPYHPDFDALLMLVAEGAMLEETQREGD